MTSSTAKSCASRSPLRPATTMRPFRTAMATAWFNDCGAYGVVSTTTSAPPPVASRTLATTSCFSTSIAASAPSSRASASLSASRPRPVMTTCFAPAARAAITQQSPRCPAPRITTRSPGPVPGDRAGPRQARRQRVEHHGDAGGPPRVHLLHHRVRRQVHALGVAAPEVRRLADIGVAVGAAAPGTRARLPAPARLAVSAAVARAHGDPIALAHAPARRRLSAYLFDDAERLVARDHGIRGVILVLRLRALVLLVVAAADAARLDPRRPVVGADRRPRELARLERARLGEDDGADGLTSRHRSSPPSAR